MFGSNIYQTSKANVWKMYLAKYLVDILKGGHFLKCLLFNIFVTFAKYIIASHYKTFVKHVSNKQVHRFANISAKKW